MPYQFKIMDVRQLLEYKTKKEFDKGYELLSSLSNTEIKELDTFKEWYAYFAYHTNNFSTALQLYKQLQYFSTNSDIIKLCDFNLKRSAIHLEDAYTNYKPENIQKINDYFKRSRIGPPIITITTTTCKRLDLFKRTINSFLECCLDLTHYNIDKWYVIDDNSSEEERIEMQTLYPFMTFIHKTRVQKGHARSLNMLLKRINTKYLFNLEDDWQFFHKDNYITYLLQIINDRTEIKQVLLNNAYGEILKEEIVGGIPYRTKEEPQLNYVQHEYAKTSDEKQLFNQKWGYKLNCSYWPYFSLRPGLTDTSIFKELGIFQEEVWHFEMNYAHRYTEKGYKTCFLPGIVCKHIGKLTSDKDGINAYVLNNEVQFSGEKEITPIRELDIMCINLDRRIDRLEMFNKEMLNMSTPINRFSAIDGYALPIPLHPQLYHLFDTNDYNYRCGIVGCALSHISTLMYFLNNPESKKYLMIMEDDLYFNPLYHPDGIGFEDTLESCLKEMEKLDGDIMCLQYTRRDNNMSSSSSNLVVRQLNTAQALEFSYGGTGCYVVNKQGAQRLLNFINERGMTNAIDTVIQKSADHLTLLYVEPLYVMLNMASGNEKIDTDIQNNMNNLNCDIITIIQTEVDWLYHNYNLKVEKDFTVNKFQEMGDKVLYSYPIYKDAWVNLIVTPSPKFKLERPYERLKLDSEYILNLR